MGLLTKVAKGVAFGDVSNQAVRNVLTEVGKRLYGPFTEEEMIETMEFFGWKCPYTERDLRAAVKNKDGSYATDHIYPQNREYCGLNVKGNLVFVDKKANNAKGSKSVEEFLLEDTDFFGNLDPKIRQKRLDKILKFQRISGYDPEKIRDLVTSVLVKRYEDARKEQEECIDEVLNILDGAGISVPKKTVPVAVAAAKPTGAKRIELVLHPSDDKLFKDALLKSKRAHFELTYDTGVVKTIKWNAPNFDVNSKLRVNIQSRPFWRTGKKDGLIKVDAFVD